MSLLQKPEINHGMMVSSFLGFQKPWSYRYSFGCRASDDQKTPAQTPPSLESPSPSTIGLGIPLPPLPRVIPPIGLPKCGEPPNSPPVGGAKGLYCCDGGIDLEGNGYNCITCKESPPFLSKTIAAQHKFSQGTCC